jgi:DNA-damage-inducible protein D
MIDSKKSLAVFEGKNIRKVWHNEEWWFVVEDMIFALTNSKNPKGYITDMRRRDEELSKGWGKLPVPFKWRLPVESKV